MHTRGKFPYKFRKNEINHNKYKTSNEIQTFLRSFFDYANQSGIPIHVIYECSDSHTCHLSVLFPYVELKKLREPPLFLLIDWKWNQLSVFGIPMHTIYSLFYLFLSGLFPSFFFLVHQRKFFNPMSLVIEGRADLTQIVSWAFNLAEWYRLMYMEGSKLLQLFIFL